MHYRPPGYGNRGSSGSSPTPTWWSTQPEPDPGLGHYLLAEGEVIREGDEYWDCVFSQWEPSSCYERHTVGELGCTYFYRRSIATSQLTGSITSNASAITGSISSSQSSSQISSVSTAGQSRLGLGENAFNDLKNMIRQRDTLALTVEEQRQRIVALREENEVLVLEKAQLRAEVEALRERLQTPSGRKFSF